MQGSQEVSCLPSLITSYKPTSKVAYHKNCTRNIHHHLTFIHHHSSLQSTMLFSTPVLTAIVAASSSQGSIETVGGVPSLLNHSFDIRTPRRGLATRKDRDCVSVSYKLHQNRHQRAASSISNEYEEVLAKYPRHGNLSAGAKKDFIRPFAYSPALQSKRMRV